MILKYSYNESISSIAHQLSTNRPKIERCIDKALQLGLLAALDDLPISGKPRTITPETRMGRLLGFTCKTFYRSEESN